MFEILRRQNDAGKTPLHLAIEEGNVGSVEWNSVLSLNLPLMFKNSLHSIECPPSHTVGTVWYLVMPFVITYVLIHTHNFAM